MTRVNKHARQLILPLFAPVFSKRIKPVLEPRAPQEKIVNFLTFDQKNYGFVFATSLGKTIIDVLAIDVFLQRGLEKILIVVPSIELSKQIEEDFYYFRHFAQDEVIVLASISKTKRQKLYLQREAKIYISTPQNIENDLKNKIISPDFWQVIIFDEAHRAVGSYAYTYIASVCHPYAKIIAQTATPWGGAKREEVKKALHIEDWYTVPAEEQLPWQLPIERKLVDIPLDEFWQTVWQTLKTQAAIYWEELQELLGPYDQQNILPTTFRFLTQKQIQQVGRLINSINDQMDKGRAMHSFATLNKLIRLTRYLFQENFETAFSYFKELKNDSSRAGKRVYQDNYGLMLQINEHSKKNLHPKIKTLLDILQQESGKQIIIFHNLVQSIAATEKYLKTDGLSSKFLIGKSHRALQKKKEADKVRQDFRDGKFKILQATQIGQEGLHFPGLEVIIFYGIPLTETAMAQAEGRIGRTNLNNKAYYLCFSELDKAFYYANLYKIKNMLSDLKLIPDIYVPQRRVKQINLPHRKRKFWVKDLLQYQGKMIRERFKVISISLRTQRKNISITFALQDQTGICNAKLIIPTKESHLINQYKKCEGEVVVVAGKVQVEDVMASEKIITILIDRSQKQNIFPCPRGEFDPADFE